MTKDLTAFIEARIAEDEAPALAASPAPWPLNAEHDEVMAVDGELVAEVFALSGSQLRATAEHIARHDPVRVLREVAARRRTLGRHQRIKDPRAGYSLPDICGLCFEWEWPCPDVRDLAVAWSDHPDYRTEWSPT